MMSNNPEKSTLRKSLRHTLRSTPLDPSAILSSLQTFLAPLPPLHIASFAPLPTEVNLLPLLTLCPHHSWFFPKVDALNLTFHHVSNPETDLAPGAFQIPEPLSSLPTIHPNQIHLFLCPGLGFDPAGGRIGKGLGFYDRILCQANPTARKFGIAYPCQLVDNTYPEPHDLPMDFVCHGQPIPHTQIPMLESFPQPGSPPDYRQPTGD